MLVDERQKPRAAFLTGAKSKAEKEPTPRSLLACFLAFEDSRQTTPRLMRQRTNEYQDFRAMNPVIIFPTNQRNTATESDRNNPVDAAPFPPPKWTRTSKAWTCLLLEVSGAQ